MRPHSRARGVARAFPHAVSPRHRSRRGSLCPAGPARERGSCRNRDNWAREHFQAFQRRADESGRGRSRGAAQRHVGRRGDRSRRGFGGAIQKRCSMTPGWPVRTGSRPLPLRARFMSSVRVEGAPTETGKRACESEQGLVIDGGRGQSRLKKGWIEVSPAACGLPDGARPR